MKDLNLEGREVLLKLRKLYGKQWPELLQQLVPQQDRLQKLITEKQQQLAALQQQRSELAAERNNMVQAVQVVPSRRQQRLSMQLQQRERRRHQHQQQQQQRLAGRVQQQRRPMWTRSHLRIRQQGVRVIRGDENL